MMEFDNIADAKLYALKQIADLRDKVAAASVGAEHQWFQALLYSLIHCGLVDYELVELGIKKLPNLAAWGLRNLSELAIVTEFVLVSEDNARSFVHEIAIDAKEFHEAVSKLTVLTHKKIVTNMEQLAAFETNEVLKRALEEQIRKEIEGGPQTAASDAEADKYRAQLAPLGLENARPRRFKQLAAELKPDLEQEFRAMDTMFSKMLHRTALSIASSTNNGLAAVASLMDNTGFNQLFTVYELIKNHIERNGVRPRP
jgi:hypothetical protein